VTTETTIAPVHKTITVRCPVEHAFRTFTEGIGGWWPTLTHSVGGEESDVRFEPGSDGMLVERMNNGRERIWGYVLDWDPPRRLRISWHPEEDRARTRVHEATEVEVAFSPEGDGTRVDLVHRGWERLKERATEARAGYDGGWNFVLGQYAAAF
jgi:uncharacterized protein YndB with AHSA1/START domain